MIDRSNIETDTTFGIVTKQNIYPTFHLYHPILVNWCITGNCQNNCQYCYGENIRNIQSSEDNINDICDNILNLQPENVVLTGGEPLIFPQIESVIEKMMGKTNILVDTNGIALQMRHMRYFRENHVVLRISLDSIHPIINEFIRPSNCVRSTALIIEHIKAFLAEGIHVIIQTVLTRYNEKSIYEMADFFVSIGVKEWRIHKVLAEDQKLCPINEREIIQTLSSRYPIQIQVVNGIDSDPSGIILVEPDGCFYTKTKEGRKIRISELQPCKPSLDEVMSKINHKSHFNRYIWNTRRL